MLGDEDSAALELQAARETFTELGAQPDLAALEPLDDREGLRDAHGLSPREREVLRLVADRAEQPGDRRGAGPQRAHRRPAPAEHLRQARRFVADGRKRVRLRARPGLTLAGWSIVTTPRRPEVGESWAKRRPHTARPSVVLTNDRKEEVRAMYVVVQHHIKNPETAFPRGQRLISGDGRPRAVKVLQFYPSRT